MFLHSAPGTSVDSNYFSHAAYDVSRAIVGRFSVGSLVICASPKPRHIPVVISTKRSSHSDAERSGRHIVCEPRDVAGASSRFASFSDGRRVAPAEFKAEDAGAAFKRTAWRGTDAETDV